MLTDAEILEILAEQQNSVPFAIEPKFTNTTDSTRLNRRIFSSRLLPVPPALCYFKERDSASGAYDLFSFFDLPDPNYSIVPFGTKKYNVGTSYNVFYGALPIQSYTVAVELESAFPRRDASQSKCFKEYNNPQTRNLWDAGHLIPHRYTPAYPQEHLCSTIQLGLNFIPQPYYANRHQINHMEARCKDGYFGVYPVYSLRFKHGRTVEAVIGKLPYRPIPDGQFFSGNIDDKKSSCVFLSFIGPNNTIYDTKIPDSKAKKNKLGVTINENKVSDRARPDSVIMNFDQEMDTLVKELQDKNKADLMLASKQSAIFADNSNQVLHHAALICYGRAATREISTPASKIQAAIIFSRLHNKPRTSRYLKATSQHAALLLDECEAEAAKNVLTYRQLKDFKQEFPEEEQIIDCLERLVYKYTIG